MPTFLTRRRFRAAGALVLTAAAWLADAVLAAPTAYTPIAPAMTDKTVTLTGHDLSIEQIVQVARYGAKVELSPAARQREADNYGLLLEAAAEGVAVYWFNRGAGDQRETVMFEGDPTSAVNKPKSGKMQIHGFGG